MKERVGDEKLIIIGVAVRGINDHIRFYSQMVCTNARGGDYRGTGGHVPPTFWLGGTQT